MSNDPDLINQPEVCLSCDGSGEDWPEYPDDPCPECDGAGEVGVRRGA